MNDRTFIPVWPEQLSDYAAQVDSLLLSWVGLLTLLVGPVLVLLAVFAYRYHHSRSPGGRKSTGNLKLEIAWMTLPFLVALGFFAWGAWLYIEQKSPPGDALEIHVVARQWMWKAQHPGGQHEINALHVPAGEPVRLKMISQDVIHSLYFPDLRIKQDVLPERYTELWFEARQPGVYRLRCAEFCGTQHARMGGALHVLEPEAYQRWLAETKVDASLAEAGAALFRDYGCAGCHGVGGAIRAPSLLGVYGGPVPLADGRTVTADARYLRNAILYPNRHVVAGFEPKMPSFKGQIAEEDLIKLIAYIKSLGDATGPRAGEMSP